MRSYDEIAADARDRPAFSNGTEGYGWMHANCDRCIHDKSAREDKADPETGMIGCPIVLVTMMSKTPVEFLDGPRDEHDRYGIADQYHCIEFRGEDDGPSPEPQPIPDPPGQELLLLREPFEAPPTAEGGGMTMARDEVCRRCGGSGWHPTLGISGGQDPCDNCAQTGYGPENCCDEPGEAS